MNPETKESKFFWYIIYENEVPIAGFNDEKELRRYLKSRHDKGIGHSIIPKNIKILEAKQKELREVQEWLVKQSATICKWN